VRFAGKTVVITGASMGIGEAIAAAFAREGAAVVLAARSRDLLEQVAERLDREGGRVLTIPTDVTRDEDVRRLAEETLAQTGRIDVLVNNAGVGMSGAVAAIDLSEWQRCLEVNVVAPVRVIQAFLPAMKAGGGSTIVQISSVLGKVSVPFTGGYNASKYALNAISDALRLEVAPHGIRVISVYPGSTESNFRVNALGRSDAPKVRIGRVPADVVAARVVEAVRTGRRDVYIRFRDAVLCWAGTRFPRLTDWALGTVYRRHRQR
jgi:short-subunit dehydrogenase